MARIPRVIALAALAAAALGGCAGTRHAADATEPSASIPSASIGEALRPLAGHWQGTIWETTTWYQQGFLPIEVTINEDGMWRGKVGASQAWGTARMKGNRLVLSGTARDATGHEDAVYFVLGGDDTRRWGQTEAIFAGREAPASVSLKRI